MAGATNRSYGSVVRTEEQDLTEMAWNNARNFLQVYIWTDRFEMVVSGRDKYNELAVWRKNGKFCFEKQGHLQSVIQGPGRGLVSDLEEETN